MICGSLVSAPRPQGRPAWNKGATLGEETRQKMSRAKQGGTLTKVSACPSPRRGSPSNPPSPPCSFAPSPAAGMGGRGEQPALPPRSIGMESLALLPSSPALISPEWIFAGLPVPLGDQATHTGLCTLGGADPPPPQLTRRKLSAAKASRPQGHTPETCAILSANMRGRAKSPAHRAAIAAGQRRRHAAARVLAAVEGVHRELSMAGVTSGKPFWWCLPQACRPE